MGEEEDEDGESESNEENQREDESDTIESVDRYANRRGRSREILKNSRLSRSSRPARETRRSQRGSSSYGNGSTRSSGRSKKVVSYNEDDLALNANENEWICSKCTCLNSIEDSRCTACDARRPRQFY